MTQISLCCWLLGAAAVLQAEDESIDAQIQKAQQERIELLQNIVREFQARFEVPARPGAAGDFFGSASELIAAKRMLLEARIDAAPEKELALLAEELASTDALLKLLVGLYEANRLSPANVNLVKAYKATVTIQLLKARKAAQQNK